MLRDSTERPEVIDAGAAKLVGANKEKIISETKKILSDKGYYRNFSNKDNIFGDGTASEKIASITSKFLST